MTERFQWLLTSPGIGLLTGEPGVGKTRATPHHPHTQPTSLSGHYLAETEYGRVDLYRALARALGLVSS
ncbi:hypothetical protein [Cupriavidus sp. D39]|uniref:hypothetical protein n=1 Tax=Cupriavidus sp. D39 TaxID=2997877 RepID=UPI00227157CA|nr:hypothetical protein [Cupriavidus sp. D39]MCY0858651.1 hypothetical protein [Cupriavidus sp. D39]